jgi:hypothetical protein
MVYKLRRMWTTASSNLERCGTAADCVTPDATSQWYTYNINTDGFQDTAR